MEDTKMIQNQKNEAERLLQIKEQIDQAQRKVERLKGTLEQLESQLKQHGCGNLEEAKKKLFQMDVELTEREKELSDGIKKLEASYDWK
jgi:TolA-binding protein